VSPTRRLPPGGGAAIRAHLWPSGELDGRVGELDFLRIAGHRVRENHGSSRCSTARVWESSTAQYLSTLVGYVGSLLQRIGAPGPPRPCGHSIRIPIVQIPTYGQRDSQQTRQGQRITDQRPGEELHQHHLTVAVDCGVISGTAEAVRATGVPGVASGTPYPQAVNCLRRREMLGSVAAWTVSACEERTGNFRDFSEIKEHATWDSWTS
jgi:hypothetical protein